jgi:hypothetical protein
MKKGEMSINMIILATIAIIVLVIVVFLLIRQFTDTKDAVDCPSVGGVCTSSDKCTQPIVIEGKEITCKISGELCCKPI